ncbi:MAG: oligosaccharide flippase family protein, partial [Finegoldia magna]|nr:oligosaccharide flippase family protein [Finegoldia magna]
LDLIITILQPISVLLMIKKYPYASTIVVIQLIMNIFLVIVCLYYSKRELNVKIKYHFKDDNLIRGIFGLSASVLLISIADQIFWKTDQIILGWLYGTETVAVYSIGSQFNSIFISTGVVITGVIVPMITRLNETPDKERKLSEIFTRIGRYQAYLVLLMLTGVILFGKEFIFIIAGKDFAGAYYVALLLMIPYSIDLIQSSGNVILLVKNKNWYKARILFISAILNVFLTFFFSKKYGMYGAALATTVSIIMASWIFMNRVYLKVIRLDIKMFWKNVIPIFGYAILSLFVGILIKKIKMSNFYIEFISHVMMYTISYFIIIFSMAMNSDEKNYIFGKIKKFI